MPVYYHDNMLCQDSPFPIQAIEFEIPGRQISPFIACGGGSGGVVMLF